AIVSDDAGGAIIAWEDARITGLTTEVDVYVQRLDPNGFPMWTVSGVPVCIAAGMQQTLSLVSDGAHGAIVTWTDHRGGPGTIYAQRVSSTGSMLWTANGVPLCTALPEQDFAVAVTDGAGGAIASWLDSRNGNFDVYAQRVDASGVVQWTAAGAAICTATGLQHSPFITSDGAGGAIMAWTDERGITPDVYAQRINGAGAVLWAANGASVCTASRVQNTGQVASDGAGGAIVAWVDGRAGTSVIFRDIYAQRMNGAGAAQWTVNGVPVCSSSGEQGYPNVVSDAAGGAIVIWHDFRSSNWDVFAQRVNSAGAAQWTANGVAICTAPDTQFFVSSASDGAGGALVAWPDGRDGTGSFDTYVQRIDGTGTVRWATNGVGVAVQPHDQHAQNVISDGAGGAIVSLDDERSWDGVTQPPDAYFDIYANRVTASGWSVTGVTHAPSASFVLTPNVPNPFSSSTRFDLILDHGARAAVDIFDVMGRKVRRMDLAHVPAGRTTIVFDGRDSRGYSLPSGQYFYRVRANGVELTRKMLILR
ncbi:MAG TPA: FlgD immunoglobulin-like domain containing protein, partial [Candidatus Krumholzibacteria bacterium]|nr:FlgD immunoglobulin-like domain containing protein [Candidatus Krumholzibacteria bacterium]